MSEIWCGNAINYDLDKTEHILNVETIAEESIDVFEVDAILDLRQFGSKYEFLVKWKGFSVIFINFRLIGRHGKMKIISIRKKFENTLVMVLVIYWIVYV
jgi:hypothetical protein